jgi:apolipoprotein N-acyltransferase
MNLVLPDAQPVGRDMSSAARHRLTVLRDFFVPLIGGILLGLPFYSEQYSWIAWVALLPTAWVLCKPGATIELYLGAFYGGLAFNLLGLDWIRQAYAGKLIDSWFVLGHLLALFWIAMVWLGRRVMQATRLPTAFVLPMFWITMEWIRWYVAGVPLEDGLPILQLGMTQASHDRLIQIASLGGIPFVSWLVAAVNGALFDAIREGARVRRQRGSAFKLAANLGGSLALVLAAVGYGHRQLNRAADEAGPTVCMVAGRFDLPDHPDAARRLRQALLDWGASADRAAVDPKGASAYPDLLVWREGAASGYTFAGPTRASSPDSAAEQDSSTEGTPTPTALTRNDLCAIAQQIEASFIFGCRRLEVQSPKEARYNSVIYVDREGAIEYYDKTHLMPASEFRPRLASALGLVPPPKSARARKSRFKPGREQHAFRLPSATRSYSFAPMICYDVLFPSEHRRLVNGAIDGTNLDFFVGVANEQPAQTSTFPKLAFAWQRFRAIECRRAYVRNAEHGISAIVDSCGRMLPTQRLELGGRRAALIGRVPIDRRRSLYVRYGDWLTIAAISFCAAVLATSLVRPDRRGRRQAG